MGRKDGDCIFETDDDNAPLGWSRRREETGGELVTQKMWCNIYQMVHMGDLWPRGFPLSRIRDGVPLTWKSEKQLRSPIQQGLANGNPDVDAIWRMTTRDKSDIEFISHRSIALGTGVWCPFNSQSTWWFPSAYPLMYLPVNATFRMTDIWRSFVAQRCLWAMGKRVVFHSPAEVFQDRNEHSLQKDFELEVPGYLHNEAIAKTLEETRLKRGQKYVCDNLRTCYEHLIGEGFLPSSEMNSVDAWIADVKKIRG